MGKNRGKVGKIGDEIKENRKTGGKQGKNRETMKQRKVSKS